jgi:hypothetical protein
MLSEDVWLSGMREDDPRLEKGFRWLISMREDDGGWAVPILTCRFDRETA